MTAAAGARHTPNSHSRDHGPVAVLATPTDDVIRETKPEGARHGEVDIVTAMTDGTFQHELPDAECELADRHEVPLLRKIASLTAVILPPLGLIAAMVLLWGVAFNWIHLVLLLGGYLLTAIGITAGYHRLFTHKSFEAVAPVKALLGVLGSMAVQGPILGWVATHRMHHQHSDRHDDPHSPHVRASDRADAGRRRGLWSRIRMFYHAHIGWFFTPDPPQEVMDRYVPDLQRDRLTVFLSKHFGTWVLLSLLIPGAIAWAVTGTWVGGVLGVLWGGAVRIFMVHHITWSINSVCHLWGTRPFKSNDHSRNNVIFGILAMGEGWHNNHHAFPASARHGLRWWQLDISYLFIRVLELFGLVRDVRVPGPDRIAAKLR
jgi:stearoyl-CoA desaturase (delta-9 desaturase)